LAHKTPFSALNHVLNKSKYVGLQKKTKQIRADEQTDRQTDRQTQWSDRNNDYPLLQRESKL